MGYKYSRQEKNYRWQTKKIMCNNDLQRTQLSPQKTLL